MFNKNKIFFIFTILLIFNYFYQIIGTHDNCCQNLMAHIGELGEACYLGTRFNCASSYCSCLVVIFIILIYLLYF
jgi:hypothetical protein